MSDSLTTKEHISACNNMIKVCKEQTTILASVERMQLEVAIENDERASEHRENLVKLQNNMENIVELSVKMPFISGIRILEVLEKTQLAVKRRINQQLHRDASYSLPSPAELEELVPKAIREHGENPQEISQTLEQFFCLGHVVFSLRLSLLATKCAGDTDTNLYELYEQLSEALDD